MPSQTTIADVARAAGVSVSTVSRILNEKPDVAETTRQRVLQIIDDLGYAPHVQARSLKGGYSRMIALVYPVEDLAFSLMDLDFFVGAARATGEAGFFFNFITEAMTDAELLNLYRSAQMDGLVLMHIHLDDWRVRLLRDNGYPFVMIGHTDHNEGLSFVDLDFENCVMDMFAHLVDLGHRKIGFVGFSADLYRMGYGPSVRTMIGFERACREFPITACHRSPSWDYQGVVQATLDMLDECPDLTAIVNVTGAPVNGTLRALQQRGRYVPDDCSVVALVTSKIAELMTPALTTVDFPSYSMGYEAARMLVNLLGEHSNEVEQILLQPDLTVRESTQAL